MESLLSTGGVRFTASTHRGEIVSEEVFGKRVRKVRGFKVGKEGQKTCRKVIVNLADVTAVQLRLV